jgi:glycine dehydrogenase subunit 2
LGASLPGLDVPPQPLPEGQPLRKDLALPEMSEGEVVRYFSWLSRLNFSTDTHFYPLGSCTMKYNPKINEEMAAQPGFAHLHPRQQGESVQGALRLMFDLQGLLSEITGMSATSLAPLAGAHGELSGMLMIRAYHREQGDSARTKVIIPDSAHGTNPASATMAGFEVVSVATGPDGNMDIEALKQEATPDLAGMMFTLPNTLGLFDTGIVEVCRIVHEAGGLVLRWSQHERAPGTGQAGRPGFRRRPPEPAQDLQHAPWRRRSRFRARLRLYEACTFPSHTNRNSE